MSMNLRQIAVVGALIAVLALGGCFYSPWWEEPAVEIAAPLNLVHNPSANLGTQGWSFSSADAFVQSDSGNPAFTSRNGAHMDQVIDLSMQTGAVVVLVGITASQTVVADRMGYIMAHFNDAANPNQVIGLIDFPSLRSYSNTPNEWVVLAAYVPLPSTAGSITVFLDVVEDPASPQDAPLTWFDDIGFYILDSPQEAFDFIDAYTADHTW